MTDTTPTIHPTRASLACVLTDGDKPYTVTLAGETYHVVAVSKQAALVVVAEYCGATVKPWSRADYRAAYIEAARAAGATE